MATCLALLCAAAGCTAAEVNLLREGNAKGATGDDSGALAFYTAAIRVDSTFSDAYFNRGLIYASQGEPYLAIRDFDAAIRYDPHSIDAYRARAAVLKECLDRYSSPESDSIDSGIRRGLRLSTAVLLYGNLTRIIALDPEDLTAIGDRIECASEIGDLESMQKDLARALRMAPEDVWLLNRRGGLRFEMGMYRTAVEDYTSALTVCDTCVHLLYNRALAWIELGEPRLALNDLEVVLTRDSEDGQAWYELGRCLVMLGKVSEGQTCMKKASSLGVSDAGLFLRRPRP